MRDKRQKEFATDYLSSDGRGILYLCPRFGKCRVGILIFKQLKKGSKILIAYPDIKIKSSWESEFKEMKWSGDVTFTTHLSMHKYEDISYDMVVIDEIHLLSERQIGVVAGMLGNVDKVLGLTGTLSDWTERTLLSSLGLKVISKYPMSQAIEEGVVTDYEIRVRSVPLDSKTKLQWKSGYYTEKEMFRRYSSIIDTLDKKGKDTKFLRLARMRLIQNSLAKKTATKKLLGELYKERVLIFCGLTKIADELGCPVYHSKKGEKQVFEDFSNGKGNHLAVVKIGNTGRTYKPLDKVVVNYFDSNSENLAQKINRCMAMEYNNINKKAIIYIVTTDEVVERKWLSKALEFFDKEKIKYE